MDNEKELSKRRNTIRFIEAAQELIEEEGLENISIRKIADKAGFHNSTIYLYFEDVDELILLASLKYFNEYSKALSELSKKKLPPREHFLSIWTFFAQTVFQRPSIFYNFFFGKHRNNLTKIIMQYYDLFPQEKADYSPEIKDMYYGKTISERCMEVLVPLAKEYPHIKISDLDIINDVTVGYVKYLLEQKCQDPGLSSSILTGRLLKMLEYILRIQGDVPPEKTIR